jgi:hypothetical protein
MAATTTLALNDDELILLYALVGRDCAECPLGRAQIGGGLAGGHAEHEHAARTALVKLSDAVLAIQERNTRDG